MQRYLIAFIVVIVPAITSIALAKPKVALTPIEGDSENEVADVVVEILAEHVKVVSPKETKRAMDKLDLSGELDNKDAKKLAAKLDADAVVQGKIVKKGKKKSLVLTTHVHGKASEQTIAFKTTMSLKKSRDDIAAAVAGVEETEKPTEKPEKPEKPVKPRKRIADNDGDGDGDGERKVRKRKGGDGDDEPEPSTAHDLGPAVRVDAGVGFGLRRLTYDSTSTTPPPTTSTSAPSARIEVEVYPFAVGTGGKGGGAEGLGLVGDFDKAIGLAITIPRSTTSVPIDQAHYSIGARYRLGVGKASVLAFGASYAGRQYIANRTNLGGSELDTPDVDYQAIAPHVVLGTPVTPTMNLTIEARALLLLKTGAISTSAQYGAGTAYGAELRGGLDVKLGGAFDLRFLAEYSQISISFKGGTLSPNQRGVTAATDRSIGLAATLAMTY